MGSGEVVGWVGCSMAHDESKRAELRSMGFTDDVMIDRALTRARGNVESAVEMLFDGVIPPNGNAVFEPGTDGPVVSPHAFATADLLPPSIVSGPTRPATPPGAPVCRTPFSLVSRVPVGRPFAAI